MNRNLVDLSVRRSHDPVIRDGRISKEDVQHQRDTLEAEHIVSIESGVKAAQH
jgi:hypothetical protein